jgi:hypothetical protein
MSAHEAIRDLLTRYTYSGDRGRLAELAACFTDAGTLEFPGTIAVGRDRIVTALGSGGGSRNPALTFVRHHITPPMIEIEGHSATARSYFQVVSNNGPDHSGTYDDRLLNTDDGWRILHRRVRVDWQAETSLFRSMVSRS